jgi:ATP phosphoribosyltransferase
VAEPLAEEGGVAVVPVEMGWSDVGDYASLADVVESNEQVAPRGSEQTVLAPPDALVYTGHKPVVVVGIPEAVVVDMDDVLFVTTRASSQDVKLAVEALGRSGLGRLA